MPQAYSYYTVAEEETPEGLMVTLKVRQESEVLQWLLSWGRHVRVLERLLDPKTIWERLTVPWYGGQTRTLDVATGTAVWYHPGLPPVAIRWVLIRDPQGKLTPQALLCTDQAVAPTQIIGWFVLC